MSWWSKFTQSAKSESEMEYVQRAGRVSITILHKLRLIVELPGQSNKVEFALKNISPSGLALIAPDAQRSFQVGKKFNAVIYFGSMAVAISIIPRHTNASVVGCQIDKGLKEYSAQFQEYFLEESLASTMYPVHTEGNRHQYATENNRSALDYEMNSSTVTHFNLHILGNTISIDPIGNGTFGFLVNSSNNQHERVMVKIHEFPEEIVLLSLRFLQSVDVIPENIKQQLCEMIKKYSNKKVA